MHRVPVIVIDCESSVSATGGITRSVCVRGTYVRPKKQQQHTAISIFPVSIIKITYFNIITLLAQRLVCNIMCCCYSMLFFI